MSYDLKELQRLEKAIGPLPYGTERSVANRELADALLVAAPELLERMAKLEALAAACQREDVDAAQAALDALTTAEPR